MKDIEQLLESEGYVRMDESAFPPMILRTLKEQEKKLREVIEALEKIPTSGNFPLKDTFERSLKKNKEGLRELKAFISNYDTYVTDRFSKRKNPQQR